MHLRTLAAALALAAPVPWTSAAPPKPASVFVLDVELGAALADVDRSVLSEALLSAMQDGSAWRLVPARDVPIFLDQERRAQVLGKNWDCVTDRCMAELAGYYGGSVVRTFIGKIGESVHATVRVTSSKSGVLASGTASGSARNVVEVLRRAGFSCMNDWRRSHGLAPRELPDVLAPEPSEVLVSFESEPSAAEVRIDGKVQCDRTPCRARVGAGAHEATFQKDRYLTIAHKFAAADGAIVKADLIPRFGWVSVETTPPGVAVSIDGKEAGTTPVAWQEVDGSAEVAVSDRCYARTSQRVALKPGERQAVKLTTAPRTTGIVVQAYDLQGRSLAGAETRVTVDGVDVGQAWASLVVPVCARELRVSLRDESFTSALRLQEGEGATIQARPTSMVRLEGGSFRLGGRGSRNEDGGPPRVEYGSVSTLAMDATEVTVAAYRSCVRAGKCEPAGSTVRWEGMSDAERESWSRFCNGDREDRSAHPVNCVDWQQAADYCRWRGKRLPTDAEWEWAARGGKEGSKYPWGPEHPSSQLCWSGDLSAGRRSGTCPVGSYPQGDTPSGVKDLAGNVWEWTDSGASAIGKFIRGGGWYDQDPSRIAVHRRMEPERRRRAVDIGFRCVKDL